MLAHLIKKIKLEVLETITNMTSSGVHKVFSKAFALSTTAGLDSLLRSPLTAFAKMDVAACHRSFVVALSAHCFASAKRVDGCAPAGCMPAISV